MSNNIHAFKEALEDVFLTSNPESWDDLSYSQQNTLVSAVIEGQDVCLSELFTEYTDICDRFTQLLTNKITGPHFIHECIRDLRGALQEQIDNEIYDYHHSLDENQWKSDLARQDEEDEINWIRRAQFPSNL